MLSYFGEEARPCGTCDVCRAERKREAGVARRNVEAAVANPQLLREALLMLVRNNCAGITVEMAAASLMLPPEVVLPQLRELTDLGQLRYTAPLFFAK